MENVSVINLIEPASNFSIQNSNPTFIWDSPGFSNNIRIVYRLRVYLYHPQFHSTYDDAIEDENFLYYDSDWNEENSYLENGSTQQISIQYPTTARELICGFKYVWFIEARDVSDSFSSGIWGWPEPVKSTISTFSYGDDITSETIIAPQINGVLQTVRPTFNVEPVSCADSYEIWLSYSDDSDVENPIWMSEALQTNINEYPLYANGLAPAGNYKWKIRINPDGEPSPWSEIFDFSIVDYSLDEPSSMQVLNTVTPTFYFSGPSDITGYELRISNLDDNLVESGNIYSEIITSMPFELPLDWAEGILPGMTYFWKLFFLDGNENIIGEIDDYSKIESFKISPVSTTTPFDGASNLSITPSFMWSGPIGVPQYEILISSDIDPLVESPFYVNQVSGTFFQYPQLADIPLEYNSTYFWKIIPLDISDNRGETSEILSFSTAVDFNSVVDEPISIRPEFTLIEGNENSPKDININLLAGVSGADEYIVYISEDQDMETLLGDITIMGNEVNGTYDGSNLDWGIIVYVQVYAILNGENIGEISSVQFLNLPDKPGSDDQVGITVNLPEGSLIPEVGITNFVTNAVNYTIEYSTNIEMSEIIYSKIIEDGVIQDIYPETAMPLAFGQTYYIQVHALDDEGMHGIPSSIYSLFIPNVTPPILNEPFSWEPTIPVSNTYKIQISTTDDFSNSAIIVNSSTESTSFFLAEPLSNGTTYYWRVQGYKENGDSFGSFSSIGLYETEGTQAELIDIEGGQIVSLQFPTSGAELTTLFPTFEWIAIESADRYEIMVTTNQDFSELVWNNSNITQNSVPYPSTGVDGLLAEKNYYWKIRAISENTALGAFSEAWTFILSNDNTPILSGPMDELSESLLPFFSWEKISQASSYGLILALNEDCTQIIFENQSITDKQFQYTTSDPPLEYDFSYYWKVIAYDENGQPIGDYSRIARFNTPTGIIELEFIYEEGGG